MYQSLNGDTNLIRWFLGGNAKRMRYMEFSQIGKLEGIEITRCQPGEKVMQRTFRPKPVGNVRGSRVELIFLRNYFADAAAAVDNRFKSS